VNRSPAESGQDTGFTDPDPSDRGYGVDAFQDDADWLTPYLDVALEGQLAGIIQAVGRGDRVVLLQGPRGVGKSTLLLSLLDRLKEPTRVCAFAARTGTTPQAVENTLRQSWASAMGLRGNAPGSAILNALCLRGLHPVIIIDDAHLLSVEALESLLSLRHEARRACSKNIGLVLASDEDLEITVDDAIEEDRSPPSFHRATLAPLTLEQTEAYLAHRLIQAGQQGEVPRLRGQAAEIHRLSGGLPAQINSIARSTGQTRAASTTGVEASRFRFLPTLTDLRLPSLRLRFNPSLALILAGAAVLTLFALAVTSLLIPRLGQSPDPGATAPIFSAPVVNRANVESPPETATGLPPATRSPEPVGAGGSELESPAGDIAESTNQDDLMTALATIEFLQHEQARTREALAAYTSMLDSMRAVLADRALLAQALEREFGNTWDTWNAEFDPSSLVIEFRSPDALWRAGELNLQPRYLNILNDFFTRIAPLLEPFRDQIEEIRLEGHTSTGWRGTNDETEAFFNNLRLSQDRTRTLLMQLHGLPALGGNRTWIRDRLTALGLSSAYPILDEEGLEDARRSRRISVRIVLDTQAALDVISTQIP
jgi:type II secretory pathway predicted ATPase ExeA/outer membrane protein OmpA-like peptidoglycan-associated protein